MAALRRTRPVPVKGAREAWESPRGTLLRGDSAAILPELASDSVDCVFADPPFNLGKDYGADIDDKRSEADYVAWQEAWLSECIRLLAPGGSLFVYNLPKWNIYAGAFLAKELTFRHWIAVEMSNGMPIRGRLYPSHYSLLYFTKGTPNRFTPPRMPLGVCRHCGAVVRDYGGYKKKMNPLGRSLSDVWSDLAPVRGPKAAKLHTNQLPIRMLDRVLDIATEEGHLVLDPFAGSGTSLICAEIRNRRWLGIELGSLNAARARFRALGDDAAELERSNGRKNRLFSADATLLRQRRGLRDGFSIPDQCDHAAVISPTFASADATLSR